MVALSMDVQYGLPRVSLSGFDAFELFVLTSIIICRWLFCVPVNPAKSQAMSSALSAAAAQQSSQQLRQDIQHELTIANQLARLISNELQLIKNFTSSGGEFENNIKKNASLISTLADTYHIDMENIPPLVRKPIDMNTRQNQNKSDEDHNNFRNESEMDDSQ